MRGWLFGIALLPFLFWSLKPAAKLNAPKRIEHHRVVALAPSLCDTMNALGLAHLLVGVSNHCQGPEVNTIAKVGTFAEPSYEAIMALKPTLVLAIPHPMAKNMLQQLESEGVEIFAHQPDSLADIHQITRMLAQKFGVEPRGDKIISDIADAIIKTKDQHKDLKASFLIAYSSSPLVVAGKNTFASQVLEALGLKNMAETKAAWPIWPLESLIHNPPDIFLLADGHESLSYYQNLFSNLAIGSKFRLLIPDRPLFQSPSPKVIDDIHQLSQLLASKNHEPARDL